MRLMRRGIWGLCLSAWVIAAPALAAQSPAEAREQVIGAGVILTDARHISKALHDLSRKGVRIFIDDFGTGYSSLGHLKRFPSQE